MAVVNSFIFFSFLFFSHVLLQSPLCSSEKSNIYKAGDSVHVIKVSSLLPGTTCSASATSTKGASKTASLNIVHRHGPCSPTWLHANKGNPLDVLQEILHQDQIRVSSLHSILSNKSSKSDFQAQKTNLPVSPGASIGTGNYIVQVGIGTPSKTVTLIFDTGSDLTWIQCEPCAVSCYEQKDPIFDPSTSTSYSNVPCNTPECTQVRSATSTTPSCGITNNCIYGIKYGDSSFSIGNFASETLTVPPDVFPNFKFGCGQNNDGLFGKAAGLMGLGRDKLSFVSQTFGKYRGVFSYCLPTESSLGYLSFGTEQGADGLVKFTPIVDNSNGPSFYFLTLISIIVGHTQLPISASVFKTSGLIIDSGTVITRLPPDVYSSLKSTFQQQMSQYPKAPAFSILDTCYDFTSVKEINIPTIVLVFEGNANMVLDPNAGILIKVNGDSQVCLAFAGNRDADDIAIIGNTQQRKLKVVYDVQNRRLGFGPGNCG